MIPRVKICGLTRPADAVLAAALGARYVGLNFWPGSKRFVSVDEGRAVARAVPAGTLKVGVFVDAAPDDVALVAMQVGLDLVQLHGDESPEACAGLTVPWIKALRIGGPADLEAIARYPGAEAVLLDAPSTGYGGSGRTFDWTLAARAVAASARPIFLAGGLTPDNVAAAVAAVRPFAVNVAGGVESAPGVKDEGKMRRFIENAVKGSP